MNTCGAKTRSGTPCKQKAGWGTDHVGEGRCKLHGGCAGRPIVTGRYSIKHRQSLANKVQDFIEDPEPANLISELALMRALLQDYLDRFPTGINLSVKSIGHVYEMVGDISKLVERITRILTQTALTMAEVQYLQARLADLVVKYITDDEQRSAFWDEYRASITVPGSSRGALVEVGTGEDS